MCHHDKTDKRLIESAREKGRYTKHGEQFLKSRLCGDTQVDHTPRPDSGVV